MPDPSQSSEKLEKSLKLFDVYAMATGAMFSSGLFLLPGLAAASTGNSVWLAYVLAGVLILPAMFCMAELSTAMPKAGGTYYFLDRSLGPAIGTVGGLGSWVAVVFKSAFALVGMGAYLGIYFDVPVTTTAVILTVVFGLVNWAGAKETTLLQRILVSVLVIILTLFVVLGLVYVGPERVLRPDPTYGRYFSDGFMGLIATVGLVFVSYAGLTKVASVAGEVQEPDRNIPLGMALALATATTIYALGTLVLVTVLPPDRLFDSLTPVADAGEEFLGWVPLDLGVALIVISAVAAFASTGNAGIMSASRYPFAMAKDGLMPERLAKVGRFGTPAIAIMATTLAMIAVLIMFDVEAVAKLASAFQLLLFGMVCIATIIMREAKIEGYKPGFRAPLYPWTPILGVLIAFWLILEMGILALGFTGILVLACFLWYQFYAKGSLDRRGAIFHVAERVGSHSSPEIEAELMDLIRERTEDHNVLYETMVGKAHMLDLTAGQFEFADLIEMVLEGQVSGEITQEELLREHIATFELELGNLAPGILISHSQVDELQRPQLFVFRFSRDAVFSIAEAREARTVLLLFSPAQPVGLELRLVGQLAETVQRRGFEDRWFSAEDGLQMSKILMRNDHHIFAKVSELPVFSRHTGDELREVELPESCLVVSLKRDGEVRTAHPRVKLHENDLLGIVGEPQDLKTLTRKKA